MFLLGTTIAAAAVAAIYVTSTIVMDCQADDIFDVTSEHNGLFNLPEFLFTWSHQFWDYFKGLVSWDKILFL